MRHVIEMNHSFIKLVNRILLMIILIVSFSVSILSQGYIVEIQGTWTKSNGANVENRQKIRSGIRINNTSGQSGDLIFIADADGKIVASCSDNCRSVVIPNTQSWGEYLWCGIVGCGSKKYTTFAAKGNECVNFDGIAVLDRNNITDLSGFLTLFSNKPDKLHLKFQRKKGNKIEEKVYDVRVSNPQVKDLQVGFYDVLEGALTSRVLILTPEIYEEERRSFSELKNKIVHWKERGLNACTIKTFTESYLDYVAKTYKDKLRKTQKETEVKP